MTVKEYINWLREPFVKQMILSNKEPYFTILKNGKNVYSLPTNEGLKALDAKIKHRTFNDDKEDRIEITIII